MNFSGLFNHSMDAKNRLFIPSRFREALGDAFYIYRAPEKCLYLYNEDGWNTVTEKIMNESNSPESRDRQRHLYKRVSGTEMDKQGRITISAENVKHAGLKKDVVIIGVGRRIEIWDLDEWNGIEDDGDDLISGIDY